MSGRSRSTTSSACSPVPAPEDLDVAPLEREARGGPTRRRPARRRRRGSASVGVRRPVGGHDDAEHAAAPGHAVHVDRRRRGPGRSRARSAARARPRAPAAVAVVPADEEALEEVRLLVGRDARAVVGHRPGRRTVPTGRTRTTIVPPVGAVLDGVGDEVDEGLLEAPVVAEDPDRGRRRVELDRLVALGRERARPRRRPRGPSPTRRSGAAGGRPRRSGTGRSRGCRRRRAACGPRCARSSPGASSSSTAVGRGLGLAEHADAGADRGQRGAQLVGDRREEVGPQPFELGQALDDAGVGAEAAAQHLVAQARQDVDAIVAVVARDAHQPEAGPARRGGRRPGRRRPWRPRAANRSARSAGVAPSSTRARAAPASGDGAASRRPGGSTANMTTRGYARGDRHGAGAGAMATTGRRSRASAAHVHERGAAPRRRRALGGRGRGSRRRGRRGDGEARSPVRRRAGAGRMPRRPAAGSRLRRTSTCTGRRRRSRRSRRPGRGGRPGGGRSGRRRSRR